MTQEDKELLLKDLCARLPYGVVIRTWYGKRINTKCISVDVYTNAVGLDIPEDDDAKVFIDNVKPYLFPLSRLNSLTDEQKKTLKVLCDWNDEEADAQSILVLYQKHFVMKTDVIDWLNKNHFDYRGLIEKGLANDATGLNIY